MIKLIKYLTIYSSRKCLMKVLLDLAKRITNVYTLSKGNRFLT